MEHTEKVITPHNEQVIREAFAGKQVLYSPNYGVCADPELYIGGSIQTGEPIMWVYGAWVYNGIVTYANLSAGRAIIIDCREDTK